MTKRKLAFSDKSEVKQSRRDFLKKTLNFGKAAAALSFGLPLVSCGYAGSPQYDKEPSCLDQSIKMIQKKVSAKELFHIDDCLKIYVRGIKNDPMNGVNYTMFSITNERDEVIFPENLSEVYGGLCGVDNPDNPEGITLITCHILGEPCVGTYYPESIFILEGREYKLSAPALYPQYDSAIIRVECLSREEGLIDIQGEKEDIRLETWTHLDDAMIHRQLSPVSSGEVLFDGIDALIETGQYIVSPFSDELIFINKITDCGEFKNALELYFVSGGTTSLAMFGPLILTEGSWADAFVSSNLTYRLCIGEINLESNTAALAFFRIDS